MANTQMILNVYLSNNPNTVVDVPITPQTTCRDVIDCCKVVGEEHCHLAELWRGCERPVDSDERIFDILRQWDVHSNEVKFYLRHEAGSTNEMQDTSRDQGHRAKRNNGLPEDTRLPPGVDLSLTELRDMATRQQHQIEAQQHMLVAKQQRLKFLKQQEQKQQQMTAEDERLHHLRDKVEMQEQKLRKLRSLRGQMDATKGSNHTLSTDLDLVRSQFAAKETELAQAVAKVEELTRQLEELKQGHVKGVNGDVYKSPANDELDRLRKELLLRNRLNDEQSSTLQKQQQTVFQRKEEMTVVDRRIEELTDRLRKTRSLGKPQLPPPPQNTNNNALVQGSNNNLPNGNVQMGVGPSWDMSTRKVDQRGRSDQDRRAPMTNGDVSQPYPFNGNNGRTVATNRPMPQKPATLFPPQSFKPRTNQSSTSVVPRQGSPMSTNRQQQSPSSWHSTSLDTGPPQLRIKPEGHNESGSDTSSLTENSSVDSVPGSLSLSNNHHAASSHRANRRPDSRGSPGPFNQRPDSPKMTILMAKTDPRITSLSERRAGDRSPMYNLASLEAALSPPKNSDATVAAQQDEWKPPNYGLGPAPGSPSRQANQPSKNGNHTETDYRGRSASTDSHLSQGRSNGKPPPSPQGKKKPPPPPRSITTGLSNPVVSGSSPRAGPLPPSDQRHSSVSSQSPEPNSQAGHPNGTSPYGGPTSTTSAHPGNHQPPTSGRSSGSSSPLVGSQIHVPTGPSAQQGSRTNDQELSSTLPRDIPPLRPGLPYSSTSMSTTDSNRSRHQRSPATVGMFVPPPPASMRNYNRPIYEQGGTTTTTDGATGAKGSAAPWKFSPTKSNSAAQSLFPNAQPDPPGRKLPVGSQPQRDEDEELSPNRPSSPLNLPMSHLYHHPDLQRLRNMPRPLKKRLSYSEDKESLNFLKLAESAEPPAEKPAVLPEGATQAGSENRDGQEPSVKDQAGNFRNNAILSQKQYTEALSQLSRSPVISNRSQKEKGAVRGILKKEGAQKKKIRVRFDPLALLLDASLEGEFDLVRRIMPEVPNPSGANDEGITALHNAICANHYEIVNFLIMNGVDVNSPDSDGWTPLHCAASCNNVIMVRNLVEHGACIYATTISDKETAADKCEEEEEGFKMCSQYLIGVQEKMGSLNGGRIFAVYSYDGEQPDELNFKDGEEITVVRRGDKEETDWWWAKKGEQAGYIPRNLFGLFPRVKSLF